MGGVDDVVGLEGDDVGDGEWGGMEGGGLGWVGVVVWVVVGGIWERSGVW